MLRAAAAACSGSGCFEACVMGVMEGTAAARGGGGGELFVRRCGTGVQSAAHVCSGGGGAVRAKETVCPTRHARKSTVFCSGLVTDREFLLGPFPVHVFLFPKLLKLSIITTPATLAQRGPLSHAAPLQHGGLRSRPSILSTECNCRAFFMATGTVESYFDKRLRGSGSSAVTSVVSSRRRHRHCCCCCCATARGA
jgi:hypothetical protein